MIKFIYLHYFCKLSQWAFLPVERILSSRVVVLNSLQVTHFLNQTVFSLCVFIIAIFQTPKVEFVFWKRLHKYKLELNFCKLLFVNVTCFIAEELYQNFTQDIEFSAGKGKWSILPMQKALHHEGMETKSSEGLG